LDVLRAVGWTPSLHPRGPHGKFARKPGLPAGGPGRPGRIGQQLEVMLAEVDRRYAKGYPDDPMQNAQFLHEQMRKAVKEMADGNPYAAGAALGQVEYRAREAGLDSLADRAHMLQAAPGLGVLAKPEAPGEVADLADKGQAVLMQMSGSDLSRFNGQVYVGDDPSWVGMMGWDGRMGLDRGTTNALAEAANGEPVKSVEPFTTLLHELLHAAGGTDATAQADGRSYMEGVNGKAIEEGFTELGSRLDAAEFTRRLGVGDLPTPVLARDPATGGAIDNPAWDKAKSSLAGHLIALHTALTEDRFHAPGDHAAHNKAIGAVEEASRLLRDDVLFASDDALRMAQRVWSEDPAVKTALDGARHALDRARQVPAAKHRTVAEELAEEASPSRLRNGVGVSYPEWVRNAQAWSEAIAKMERKAGLLRKQTLAARAADLAREVAYAGTRDKSAVLAAQLLRAAAVTDSGREMENGETLTAYTRRNVVSYWLSAGTRAADQVATQVGQLRRWLDAGT